MRPAMATRRTTSERRAEDGPGRHGDGASPPALVVSSPLARAPLALASGAYALAATLRNLLYDARVLRISRVDARVVSVGNVVAGGTGKTPIVAHLARAALARSRRVAVVSRGYGRRPDQRLNDENSLLVRKIPGASIVESPDRVAGAGSAVRAGADLVLLDDGFQHRRIHRDADIVLVDATRPLEEERCLPLGFLREPLGAALGRATSVVLTRAELVLPARREALLEALEKLGPTPAVAETVVEGLSPLGPGGAGEGPAFLFAGIGNPAAFRRTAGRAGIEIAGFRAFRDHHPYRAADLGLLAREAAAAGASRLVTTEKDAVKLEPIAAAAGSMPIAALAVGIRFSSGEDGVLAALLG